MAELNDEERKRQEKETVWVHASQWISRTLAVTLIMVGPGILGSMLDRKFGTSFLGLLGFAFGLVAGTTGLLVLAKQFTPKAGGKPLPWDEETTEDDEHDDSPNRGDDPPG